MKEMHVAHVLRNRANKYKDREVFRFKEDEEYKSLSWNDFKNLSELVSKFLISEGIEVGANVGIYSQNYHYWTIADLGIISARAVVVPIYATSSYSQVAYIAKETEMQVMFIGDDNQFENAQKALNEINSLKRIINFNCKKSDDERIITIEELFEKNYETELEEILSKRLLEASINDLASIVYTSGTTGEPKGAMLDHHNFIAAFRIHDKRLDLRDTDVSMCFLPLSHIFERTWTYYALHCGATNVYNVNPKEIINELPIAKPTVMCVVPRFFEKTYEGVQLKMQEWGKAQKSIFNWALNVGLKFIEYQKDGIKPPVSLSWKQKLANALVMKKVRSVFGGNIRYMPCAGSALSKHLLKFFHAMGLIINYGYGTTETTATVSCMRNDVYDFESTGSVMPEVEVKISDEKMILVKGETVFKGYYKKPDETKEVLKDGWYYTGDQGFIPKEGTLHMTERIKDIIKTSTGKYVSPQKVELLLSQSNLIEQLCVIGDNRKYLTALIVPVIEQLEILAKNEGILLNAKEELKKHPKVLDAFKKHLEKIQEELSPFEKVVKFKLLPEPFTIDNAMLTNSLKVRRKQVNSIYAKEIAEMYS
jgi:long-chain acyl-CoA synthetase